MMESIEKLRDYANEHIINGSLMNAMIDEIEREIAEKYMELPVDADGVPIHVGDVVEFGESRNQGIVKAFNEHMVITLHVDDDYMNYAKYGLLWNADECRHVEPRTVEDVLRDCCNEWNEHLGDDWESGVYAKYADELRELLGVGE